MKIKTLVLMSILCLAVLIIFGSCATMKSPDKLTYDRFCGTWANQKYEGKGGDPRAKTVLNPDGTYVGYQYLVQTGPAAVGKYTVEKRWVDDEGNYYYHVLAYSPLIDVTKYELWKINNYNSVWESNQSNSDFPVEIDPKGLKYRIYYRY